MLWIFVIFSLSFCSCTGKSITKDDSWEFLHLAQFWPATSCYVHFGKQYCSGIPKGVAGWTIHGLWPSRIGSEEPQYCNSSLKFDFNQIKGLTSTLQTRWPSYNTSADPTSLWKHEWEKHGTCAMSLPALRGEPHYFSLTMILQQSTDLYGNLARHKILPSSTVKYQPADIYWAIRDGVGVDPNVVCSYDNKTQRHYVEQIWICFTKEFLLQDCPDVSYTSANRNIFKNSSRFSNCPDIGTPSVYYLPLSPPSQGYKGQKLIEDKIDEPKVDHKLSHHQSSQSYDAKEHRKLTKQTLKSVVYFRSDIEKVLRYYKDLDY